MMGDGTCRHERFRRLVDRRRETFGHLDGAAPELALGIMPRVAMGRWTTASSVSWSQRNTRLAPSSAPPSHETAGCGSEVNVKKVNRDDSSGKRNRIFGCAGGRPLALVLAKCFVVPASDLGSTLALVSPDFSRGPHPSPQNVGPRKITTPVQFNE